MLFQVYPAERAAGGAVGAGPGNPVDPAGEGGVEVMASIAARVGPPVRLAERRWRGWGLNPPPPPPRRCVCVCV